MAAIWMVSLGTVLSALFILAANAWMQHPVGYRITGGKAELTDFWALLANSTLWAEFSHTVLAAFVTGAMFVLGVSAWQLLRGRHGGEERNNADFRRAARLSAWFALIGTLLVMITGDLQARLMDSQQPMKMAAAEALYHTQSGASFSLLTIGNLSGQPVFQIRVPHLLSLIADMSWNGKVAGITQLQNSEAARYGAGGYAPVLWVTYWSFRLMVGLGFVMLAAAAWAAWVSRRSARRGLSGRRWTMRALACCIAAPFLANTFGWLFTEMGRQPWIVYGLMKTAQGVSPGVSAVDVALSLGGFALLYTVLGIIDVMLMIQAGRRALGGSGPPAAQPSGSATGTLVY
jgi:cytochrome d ubiquinol oxidase subunit I